MKTIEFHAMGSKIFIAMDTDDLQVMDEALNARDWFEEWEEVLSRFRLTSELSQINRNPGQPIKVSETLFEVASLAQMVETRTHGLISPAILSALVSAGYTENFEDLLTQTEQALRQPSMVLPNMSHDYDLDKLHRRLTIGFGTQLDFGGFAKGWAAHQTMLRLQQFAPVLVDAGGDIAMSGPLNDGVPWLIGVADPFNLDTNLDLLLVPRGGVATSGKDYRRWFTNHTWQHHLIDTRTNRPAETDVLTATVIAPNVMEAELNAKMGLILGSEAGTEWLNSQVDLEYILVLDSGIVLQSAGYHSYQWSPQWNQLEPDLPLSMK